MRRRSRGRSGFTLVEVVIALLLLGLTIGALLTSFVTGRIASYHARYQAQGMNLLQAKVEELSVGPYDAVHDAETVVTVDPGQDLASGTSDDLMGHLRVKVADLMDLDRDGDTGEKEIDLDRDGVNDPCKPVHLTLTWTCLSYGGDTTVTASLDTLIGER